MPNSLYGPDGLRDPLAIMYEALGTEYGLLLRVSDPEEAKRQFAAERRKVADFDLTRISLKTVEIGEANLAVLKRRD